VNLFMRDITTHSIIVLISTIVPIETLFAGPATHYTISFQSLLPFQGCQLQLFPLMRKKVPAATPSSPRDRPTPQNTAGPTLGTGTSTSRIHTHSHFVYVLFNNVEFFF